MNKKKVVLIGALFVGLFMFYRLKLSGNKSGAKIGAPLNSLGAKPVNQTGTQPWYTGITSFMTGQAENYAQNPTSTLQQSSSVVQSMSSISGTVSNWFGGSSSGTGQTPPPNGQNAQTAGTQGSPDDLPANNDPSTDLPASSQYGSTMVGDLTTDQSLQITPVSIMSSGPDNSTIDMSDPTNVGADATADFSSSAPTADYDSGDVAS